MEDGQKISRFYCLEDWKKSPGKEDCLRRGAQSLDLRFLEQKSAQVSFFGDETNVRREKVKFYCNVGVLKYFTVL